MILLISAAQFLRTENLWGCLGSQDKVYLIFWTAMVTQCGLEQQIPPQAAVMAFGLPS